MKRKTENLIANSMFMGGFGFMCVIMFWIPALDNPWVFFGSMGVGFIGMVWMIIRNLI